MTIIGVDNSKKDAKINLRWLMLQKLGAEAISVFEPFGGHGVMYAACYQHAKKAFRCDIRQECGDLYHFPAVWAANVVDLQEYNVFDIDPYRNPWEIVWLISQRRRFAAERVAFVVTDGFIAAHLRMGKTLRRAGFSKQMLDATGWNPDGESAVYMTSEKARQAALAFFRAWFPAGEIEWWASSCGGPTVNYHAFVLAFS